MKKRNDFMYNFLKTICEAIFYIIYRPSLEGKENIPLEGSFIFASNHKHALDPLLIARGTKRKVTFLAKIELFKGIHGRILRKLGMIPVDRSKRNVEAVIEAEKVLENNEILAIFPEGKRNRTKEELLPLKKGTVRIAKKCNTLIVPCAIKGEYKLFRKSIKIVFGKPIKVDDLTVEEVNEKLREKIIEMLRK